MASEPAMFPLPPGSHRTYVKCAELPWPHTGVGLIGACRSCEWVSPTIRAFYESAHDDCFRHAREMDEESGNPWWGTYGPY